MSLIKKLFGKKPTDYDLAAVESIKQEIKEDLLAGLANEWRVANGFEEKCLWRILAKNNRFRLSYHVFVCRACSRKKHFTYVDKRLLREAMLNGRSLPPSTQSS